VLNRGEVAIIDANFIAERKNDDVINSAFENSYAPIKMREEFLDKVGVLGYDLLKRAR
jgi:hypothetical protein